MTENGRRPFWKLGFTYLTEVLFSIDFKPTWLNKILHLNEKTQKTPKQPPQNQNKPAPLLISAITLLPRQVSTKEEQFQLTSPQATEFKLNQNTNHIAK